MIIIRNLRRLQQHLANTGIDNQVELGTDPAGSTSFVRQMQEWFNTNPEFLEYQKQHGIRSVVVNHQHDAVITFKDDAHEAMYRLGEFEAIKKTDVEVNWDLNMDTIIKHMQTHMSERIYDIRHLQGDWNTIHGPSPNTTKPPKLDLDLDSAWIRKHLTDKPISDE